jgi:hypothetical protein
MLEETRGGGEGGSKLGFLDLDSPSELLQWGRWKFWNELACERKEGQLRIMNPPFWRAEGIAMKNEVDTNKGVTVTVTVTVSMWGVAARTNRLCSISIYLIQLGFGSG